MKWLIGLLVVLVLAAVVLFGVVLTGGKTKPTAPHPSPTVTVASPTPTPTPTPTTAYPTPTPSMSESPTPTYAPSPTTSPSYAPSGGKGPVPSDAKDLVGEYVTYYPPAEYRNINQSRAAQFIDGTVVRPGETFAFNKVVGKRTRARGFVPGWIIVDGVFKKSVGGGISQVATTLNNAVLEAGLQVVERHAHSFWISRYPAGRDATEYWGHLDYQFKNDTPHNVLVKAWVVPSHDTVQGAMHIQLWSTKTWRVTLVSGPRTHPTPPKVRHITGKNCEPNIGYDGFTINVIRTWYKPEIGTAGSTIPLKRERIHTVYTPSDTVICDSLPNPTATPTS